MPLTYAIADLHGRYDLLEEGLNLIEADSPQGRIIFLGDYIDRGPQSAQIIRRLFAGPSKGWEWICIQGNHEAMMLETILRPLNSGWWMGNGGSQTLLSYEHPPKGRINCKVVPDNHLEWLLLLPLLYIDKHRVYVHAGVDRFVPLDQQDPYKMQWKLYDWNDPGGHDQRHVVHGHQQIENGPLILSGRTNLDTFAWLTGRLVVGVFDDDIPGGPVRLIEVKGDPS